MCFPIDVDLAMDAHRERDHTLELANRLALRDSTTSTAFLHVRKH